MDPDRALANIRVQRVLIPELDGLEREEAIDKLLEAIAALDEWLSRGGYFPLPWACRNAHLR